MENVEVSTNREDVQRQIALLMRDKTIDNIEKNNKIMKLMKTLGQATATEGELADKASESFAGNEKSFFNFNKPGCKHYFRSCMLLTECCKKLFACRFCHDEVADHKMDRYATKMVLCMDCRTLQDISDKCKSCLLSFARYFCSICKFYDSHNNKDIFHCNECNLCRIGTPETVFHCNECNTCIASEYRDHKHTENVAHCDCPVCSQDLFTSTKGVRYLKCGHPIHSSCFEKLLSSGHYVCPVCKKSYTDMERYWSLFDATIKENPMPKIYEEYQTTADILCNDCNLKQTVPFHCMGVKCLTCNSYNTSILQVNNMPPHELI